MLICHFKLSENCQFTYSHLFEYINVYRLKKIIENMLSKVNYYCLLFCCKKYNFSEIYRIAVFVKK